MNNFYSLFSLLAFITAAANYINIRFLKLPKAIGLTVLSLILSIACMYFLEDNNPLIIAISSYNIKMTVLDGMISFLLFGSALHFNLADVKKEIKAIFALASFGVIISTLLIASLLYLLTYFSHLDISFGACLVFGALISPTDPIAVISTLKDNKNISNKLKTRTIGESLFNDATGIVLFVVLTNIFFVNELNSVHNSAHKYLIDIVKEIGIEAGGGIILGWCFAFITTLLIKKSKDSEVNILITIAIASTGYLAAHQLGVSGPIAMVVAGLFIGNNYSSCETTCPKIRKEFTNFWELIDKILNSFLFILIGLEIIDVDFSTPMIITGLVALFIIIFCRFISVFIPIMIVDRQLNSKSMREKFIMSWAGVRGGISIALASSLDNHMILSLTYMVVVFSIFIQGITLKHVLKLIPASTTKATAKAPANDPSQLNTALD